MKKVWLDAGHGGTDSGALGNNLREKDITLQLVLHARAYLEHNYSVDVQVTRSTDVFVSLSDRASRANAWGADIFVSMHINAGGGTGFETYRYPSQEGSQSSLLQKELHTEILTIMRKFGTIADRGLKTANYAVLRETNMPAVLTENLFIDTTADAEKLKSATFLREVGEAHARGIAKYLNLPSNQVTFYTIQSGDTFYSIAKKYNITVQQLQDANPGVDPTKLQIGQQIVLPVTTYTVQAGDTFYSIAKKYSITVQQLQDANPGVDPAELQIGQQIIIPAV
ncbi:N-acetylmuramoyl-L-alanine amidase family protein [Priestia megaterium]|uniref:N-acetylmuramoyl-L-alanine amidase family protein n=1 Tax=Priestia megaterium TaxID=1404 RepID=UPI00101D1B8D|nr:N-acetylmuramoyl-L-alanine amidase [Priestia megaterium]